MSFVDLKHTCLFEIPVIVSPYGQDLQTTTGVLGQKEEALKAVRRLLGENPPLIAFNPVRPALQLQDQTTLQKQALSRSSAEIARLQEVRFASETPDIHCLLKRF